MKASKLNFIFDFFLLIQEVFNSLVSHGVSKSKIVEAIIHESTAQTLPQDHCSNIEDSQTNLQKETANKIVSDEDVASTKGIIKPVESCSEDDDDDDHSISDISSCKKKRARGRGHLKKKKKLDSANDKKDVPTKDRDKDRTTTEETDKHTSSPSEEINNDANLISMPTATVTIEGIKQRSKPDSRRCIG